MEIWRCNVCGKEIPKGSNPNQLYCSEACARKAHRQGLFNKNDKRKRAMSYEDRLAAYLSYGQSCACCGFSMATPKQEYCAVFKYALPDALKLLPEQDANELKEGLKGANGGCEIHHIVPIAEGGDNSKENLILLCPNCHKQVHAGIISRSRLIERRIIIPDEVLFNACWNMILDIKYNKDKAFGYEQKHQRSL